MAKPAAMEFLRQPANLAALEQSKAHDAKKWVWITDKQETFKAATVKSTSGDTVIVVDNDNKEITIKSDDVMPMNPPKFEKAEDMAALTYLNEASVLHNLKSRYVAGMIYTYSGLFCIAVNPYRRLPIYSEEVVQMFRGKRRQEMPPHVFAIVDNAYQDMLADHENQSVLITGESGAGKTENTKKVIQYVAKVAGVEKKGGAQKEDKEKAGLQGDLDEQVVAANPLLESFGNAKTTRNNNSSRFGKFIRCHFSTTGKLAGADIESYLLEKSRVVFQMEKERNYHIFYQLLYATPDDLQQKLLLTTRKAEDYGFLEKGCYTVDGIDDHEEYGLTENAIKVLGFTEEERMSMYKICAGILNFSNMKFKQRPRDEQAEVADPADGEKVGFLFGIPVTEFHKSLVKPRIKVGTEFVNKGQNLSQVTYSVGALSKAIYERMFWWIVKRVNQALDTKERRSYFIGVLDIAGFEIFEYNTFEQLCINLTNEKLQQFFNHNMFVLEQEEYKKEGIHWDFIDFGLDLEQTINLIEKPMGVFAILEEECIVPKASDKTFLQKLHKTHEGKHPSYGKPSMKIKADFILHHYAGSVGYSVEGWLEKNKDPINEAVAALFAKATDPLVSLLFQDYNPDVTGGRRKGSAFQTVSNRHKEQLNNLLVTLGNTSPNFVRCIIPNEQKKAGVLDSGLVLHQLRCNGVLEGIRICRKGFPSRMVFQDFKQRYQILAPQAIGEGFIDGRLAADKLITALQLEQSEYRIGTSKVFFRAGIVGELEEMRDERLSKIIAQFQAYCKGYLMRKQYKRMCDQRLGIFVLQRNVRKYLAIREWKWWKLYTQVKPLLNIARAEDEMKEKEEMLKSANEKALKNEQLVKEMEEKLTSVMEERQKLFEDLQRENDRLVTAEDKLMKMQTDKDKAETQLTETLEKLEDEESTAAQTAEEKRELEDKIEEFNAKQEEFQVQFQKLENDKSSKDKQIDALNDDLNRREDSINKLNKEKKGLDESLAETTTALQAEEDKVNHLNKVKAKLESTVADTEASLQREKDSKNNLDKAKRKVEQELKNTQTTLEETLTEKRDVEDTLKKREKVISEQSSQMESDAKLIAQLQKKIAELQARIEELEEDLENEKKLRQKVDRQRADLDNELSMLNERLDEAGGATAAQIDINKKREADIQKLRREIEQLTANNEQSMSSTRNKMNQQLSEAQDEIESIKKAKAKSDKEKNQLSADLDEVSQNLEVVKKQKGQAEKQARGLDDAVNDYKQKLASLESSLSEVESQKTKLSSQGVDYSSQIEQLEHNLGVMSKAKKALEHSVNEAKSLYDAEVRVKQDAQHKLQQANMEIDQLQESLDEEQTARNDIQGKLSRAVADASQWKSKYEMEGASRVEELEDAKRRLTAKVQEMEEALAIAETKASGLDKIKNRMNDEVEDLMIDLEKAQNQCSSLEKKQKKVDQQINEWRSKCDSVQADLDHSQREARTYSADLMKIRGLYEESLNQSEAFKKEIRNLNEEVRSVTSQLSEGGKSSHEVEKMRRKLEMEKDEMQLSIEELEGALEQEEGKFLKSQLEVTQLRQEMQRKLQEKDEELDSLRKNQQRQLDSLQAMVDNEARSKSEQARQRKKIEGDVGELEGALESATRLNADQAKAIKKLQQQIKESQAILDDEARARDELRGSGNRAERKVNELGAEIDELRIALEQSERSRKLMDSERSDTHDRISDLQSQLQSLMASKRKVENDYHNLQEEIDEIDNSAKAAEDRAAKAASETAKAQADLAMSQDALNNAERSKAASEKAMRDLQQKLEEAEAAGGSKLKNQIRKLEMRVNELEGDVDNETRKNNEALKAQRKAEKRYKDLQIQMEEDRRNGERAHEQVEKLNMKLKKMRQQVEDLEGQTASNLAKYRKAQAEIEDAEERAESAETALAKARARSRGAAGGTRSSSRSASAPRSPRARMATDD